MSPAFLEKPLLSFASAIAGATVTEIVHRFRARTALVAGVAERYIAEIRASNADDTPAFRLGTMQRAGVALLSPRQVTKFCAEVVARGCTHPFKDSDLEQFVPFNKFSEFLRGASASGITLSNDEAIYRFLLRCSTEENPKKKRTD